MAMDASTASQHVLANFIFNVRNDRGKPVSPKTAGTYASSVIRIRKILGGDPMHDNWLHGQISSLDDIVNSMPLSSRKTVLTGLLMWLDLLETRNQDVVGAVRARHNNAIAELKTSDMAQKASQKQKENWVQLGELRDVGLMYEKQLREQGLLRQDSAGELPAYWRRIFLRWLLTRLYLTEDNPPLRLDYRDFRWISKSAFEQLPPAERDAANYLVVTGRNKKFFSLGRYKTASTYGTMHIPIGKQLNYALNCWRRFHKGEYLLGDAPLSAPRMTQLITNT